MPHVDSIICGRTHSTLCLTAFNSFVGCRFILIFSLILTRLLSGRSGVDLSSHTLEVLIISEKTGNRGGVGGLGREKLTSSSQCVIKKSLEQIRSYGERTFIKKLHQRTQDSRYII